MRKVIVGAHFHSPKELYYWYVSNETKFDSRFDNYDCAIVRNHNGNVTCPAVVKVYGIVEVSDDFPFGHQPALEITNNARWKRVSDDLPF